MRDDVKNYLIAVASLFFALSIPFLYFSSINLLSKCLALASASVFIFILPVALDFFNVENLSVSKEKRNGALIFSAVLLLVDTLYILNVFNSYIAVAMLFATLITVLIYYRKPLKNHFRTLGPKKWIIAKFLCFKLFKRSQQVMPQVRVKI